MGNLFYPGNMLPFTGGKGTRTPPTGPEGRGGREVAAAVPSASMHRQGGGGWGGGVCRKTTLS